MKTCAFLPVVIMSLIGAKAAFAAEYLSHPPAHPAPHVSGRAMREGPALFVDAANGDDANDGSEARPWQTVNHALKQLSAGDTLYMHGGTYYERVYCSVVGSGDKPVTIRSYPGESAVIDGGYREFFESPAEAWEPYSEGADGEFRSAGRYKNIRNVIGAFGDSMVGLQTYYHAIDLRSKDSVIKKGGKDGLPPWYCGPGIWLDRESGFIHARLAHTEGRTSGYRGKRLDYRGVTDPRKVPLVIAPFHSVPLTVDRAEHVRFQDLTVRGGGYDTVIIKYGVDVEFDNVTVHCGTYGLRARNTGPFRFHRSALYGNIPPWGTRGDNSLMTYPGRKNRRDFTRLTGHALLVTEGFAENSVYAYPHNRDWEISYSEFTDCHDGLYLGGLTGSFHHNFVANFQDDAIYISPMYWHPLQKTNFHIHDNVVTDCLIAFGMGGPHDPDGTLYIYRNVLEPVLHKVGSHGSPKKPNIVWEDPKDPENTTPPDGTDVGRAAAKESPK